MLPREWEACLYKCKRPFSESASDRPAMRSGALRAAESKGEQAHLDGCPVELRYHVDTCAVGKFGCKFFLKDCCGG